MAQYAKLWILIKTNRYKPQLGNPEVPWRWLQNATPICPAVANSPGTNDSSQSEPAKSSPEITVVAMGDLCSDIVLLAAN